MADYRYLFLCVIVMVGCSRAPRTGTAPPPETETPAAVKPTGGDPVPVVKTEVAPKITAGDRVVLTERAAQRLRSLTEETSYLRVSVDGDRLKLDLDPATDLEKDLISESRGIRIAVDRKSAALLPMGIVVDFLDEGGATGFKFASPGREMDRTRTGVSLAEARRGFKTTLRPKKGDAVKTPVAQPPEELFTLVRYDAAPGRLAAYLTPDPKDGKKHPAILWITGGDCNTIDEGCWRDGAGAVDQSASAYRKAGIVMMFPSLRGGNDNPGSHEGFLGEVEDVLAAAAFLRKQPYVDPDRVYLGGHSTGGTMALVTGEYSDSFRAVLSFGPVSDVLGYGLDSLSFSIADPKELQLRSPGWWLHSIRSPVFAFEGEASANASDLRSMKRETRNPNVHCYVVKGADHFNVLGPTNSLIAGKILKDTGPQCNLAFTEEEINALFRK